MLELKNIKKDYLAGENTVHALKGITLQFRQNEFVSILGPSGCGKTTMLNIIGGLDQYTSGDLVINGKSTKDFKDRDWDAYRNHSIGFVFQSYNLIPHQTVLQNVELALTLSGVSKSERRERAKKALEAVGLGNQLHKKPSEMSGGQMQRVAIARAIVNNPDIILADEPTGALDSETSVQVMEILKEIAKNRLVIMVTHNPDLAEQYSTRIIRMLDGNLVNDSKPLTDEEIKQEKQTEAAMSGGAGTAGTRREKKPSMSFATSFSLSLKNLFTKKGRTILTSFAGSIGIIGIALILSISQGLTAYIDMIQENTLSSYPLTIESSVTDMSKLMNTFMSQTSAKADHELNAVYTKPAIRDIIDSLNNLDTAENDLKTFKEYIEAERSNTESELNSAISGVQYSYDLDLLVYTKNVDGTIIHSDTEDLLTDLAMEYLNLDMSSMMDAQESLTSGAMDPSSMMSMMGGTSMNLWQEILPGNDGETVSDVVKNQYDMVYGSWPDSYNEIVLVLDENNELDDMTLYALGLESKEDIDALMDATVNQAELDVADSTWSYEDICDMEFRIILNSDCYTLDETTGTYTDLRDTSAGLQYLYDNGLPLKVAGIIRPKEDSETTILSGTIGYTSALTEYVIEHAKESDALKAQLEDDSVDVFTGLSFKDTAKEQSDEAKEAAFQDYAADLDEAGKADLYVQMMSIPSEADVNAAVEQAMAGLTREDIEAAMLQGLTEQMSMSEADVTSYLSSMEDEELTELFSNMMSEQIKQQMAEQITAQMSAMSSAELAMGFEQTLPTLTAEQCAIYYDEIVAANFSDATYEDNLTKLGYVELDTPSAINLYASTFEDKDIIADAIDTYNDSRDELSQITYTDYVGLMMSSMTSIINAITYILIAFVAISLIVSSIMIAVITLISVQERTKEIGILRAIGASKHDVSSMFNAETIIIGFTSGALGILITCLLCIPINHVIHSLTGITTLNAALPAPAAVILILISMVLTLFSGFIPSKSAARKDPVVALRSE